MDALNHAKITNAFKNIDKTVEGNVSEDRGLYFRFFRAYGTSPVTLKRLQAGDGQRNIASVPDNLVVAEKVFSFCACEKICFCCTV